jgi:hypothetical protein
LFDLAICKLNDSLQYLVNNIESISRFERAVMYVMFRAGLHKNTAKRSLGAIQYGHVRDHFSLTYGFQSRFLTSGFLDLEYRQDTSNACFTNCTSIQQSAFLVWATLKVL